MEPPSSRHVTVLNESRYPVPEGLLEHAVGVALAQHGLEGAEVCLLITSDERIHEMNRIFRGVDEPTDVLTFPSGEESPAPLGDVAISLPYAERQARARGVSLEQELGFLAIHGALHLAGFDDETEPERAGMVREMNRAAVAAGLDPDEEWASILHGDPS
jgi:rRNA maturation RNase YbeY